MQREKAECGPEAMPTASSVLPTPINPGEFSTPQSKHFMGSTTSTPTQERDPLTPNL